MLEPSSPMCKKASKSEIKSSALDVSLVSQGSSPLPDPSSQKNLHRQGSKKRAGAGGPGQAPHLAATNLRELEQQFSTFFPYSPPHPTTCGLHSLNCPAPLLWTRPRKSSWVSWSLLYIISFILPGHSYCRVVEFIGEKDQQRPRRQQRAH